MARPNIDVKPLFLFAKKSGKHYIFKILSVGQHRSCDINNWSVSVFISSALRLATNTLRDNEASGLEVASQLTGNSSCQGCVVVTYTCWNNDLSFANTHGLVGRQPLPLNACVGNSLFSSTKLIVRPFPKETQVSSNSSSVVSVAKCSSTKSGFFT